MSDAPPAPPKPTAATIEVLLPIMAKGTEQQLATVDSLDAKVVQVFAAASVVLGLSAAGTRLALHGSAWLVGGAVGAYVAVAVASVFGLAVRSYSSIPDADTLWDNHWPDTPDQAKHGLADALAEAFRGNRGELCRKAWAVRIAISAAGIQATCIGIALLQLVR